MRFGILLARAGGRSCPPGRGPASRRWAWPLKRCRRNTGWPAIAPCERTQEAQCAMLEAIADGDANRQLEQVRNFISRRVDGIIIVPKDAQTPIPMIREANGAGIPIVLFNRPPAKSDAKSVRVVADNYSIAKLTVDYMVAEALKMPGMHKAAILIGDSGDINAIDRRDGFEEALKPYPDASKSSPEFLPNGTRRKRWRASPTRCRHIPKSTSSSFPPTCCFLLSSPH